MLSYILVSKEQKPTLFTSNQILGHPHIADNIAAAAELLIEEPSVSTDIIRSMALDDVIAIDCGPVRYKLSPTILPGFEYPDNKNYFFRVIDVSADSEDTEPRLPLDTVMTIDGTAAMPSGTMVSPGYLARNGYLALRVPWIVEESDRTAVERDGFRLNERNEVLFPDGKPLFNPDPFASELMYHIAIQRADGSEENLF
jgi:hypothetical protein